MKIEVKTTDSHFSPRENMQIMPETNKNMEGKQANVGMRAC